MRHRKKRNKLSRDASHREALLSNLSKQLIEHERIQTSQAKAKAVKPEVEKLITLAKRGDLHARRQALSTLHNDKFIVHKLFDEVAPRYSSRPGGYTRIVKLGPRRSDSTEMVYLELVRAPAPSASISNTTAPASRAGRSSRARARSKPSWRRGWRRSFASRLRWPSPVARMPASMPGGRWPALPPAPRFRAIFCGG